MTKFKPMCVNVSKNKIIKLVDKKGGKSCIHFINNNCDETKIIDIDGCEINTGNKCDFMVISKSGKEFFIELKGGEISHGILQIEETIKLKSQKIDSSSFIVCTKVSPKTSTKRQIYKAKFLKHYNSYLSFHSGCFHQVVL